MYETRKEYLTRLDKALLYLLKNDLIGKTVDSIENIITNIEPFASIVKEFENEIKRLSKRNKQLENEWKEINDKNKEIARDNIQVIKDLRIIRLDLKLEKERNLGKSIILYKKHKEIVKNIRKLEKIERDLKQKRVDYERSTSLISELRGENKSLQLRIDEMESINGKIEDNKEILDWLKDQNLPTKLAEFKLVLERSQMNATKVREFEDKMLKAVCVNCGSNNIIFDGKKPLLYRAGGDVIDLNVVLKEKKKDNIELE